MAGSTHLAEQDDVMQRLAARNHQPTSQRRTVLRTLMNTHACVTPRELHAALHDEQPGIGQATVYRTLELLVEVGAATRFVQDNNESKYIYCSPHHHHHLICTRCGLVKDIDGCLLQPLGPALEQRTSFQINDHAVTIYGYCAGCKTEQKDLA
jgi:Fur family transcriptional regulator, ferric uptake regulator